MARINDLEERLKEEIRKYEERPSIKTLPTPAMVQYYQKKAIQRILDKVRKV
jgi:hypothetical protein